MRKDDFLKCRHEVFLSKGYKRSNNGDLHSIIIERVIVYAFLNVIAKWANIRNTKWEENDVQQRTMACGQISEFERAIQM